LALNFEIGIISGSINSTPLHDNIMTMVNEYGQHENEAHKFRKDPPLAKSEKVFRFHRTAIGILGPIRHALFNSKRIPPESFDPKNNGASNTTPPSAQVRVVRGQQTIPSSSKNRPKAGPPLCNGETEGISVLIR
jgi:hypothetical protein